MQRGSIQQVILHKTHIRIPSSSSIPLRSFSTTTALRRTRMPPLNIQHVNPQFLKVEYAVRGELAIKAEDYKERLKTPEGKKGLKFDRVVNSNIGNPQQRGLDQKPLTFGRQVSVIGERVQKVK